jgi:hypothetical protein
MPRLVKTFKLVYLCMKLIYSAILFYIDTEHGKIKRTLKLDGTVKYPI